MPSALSVLIVMAAYAWLGIPLSAAAAGAAAMQFGLGIDGVVLLFVAYRHVGRVVSDDGREDLAGPAVSMLLGMWTTAATFYGLAVVDFPSLEELGLLIGHSMMVCGVLTLVLVPALLPATPPAVSALTTGWLPRLVVRRRALILGAAAVITVAAAIAAPRLRIDPSLDRLRATSPAAGFEAEVTTRFGVPRDVYLVVDQGAALEPLLEANERLVAALAREAPGVPAHAPSLLLPSARTQQAAASRIAAQGIAAGPRPGGPDGGGRRRGVSSRHLRSLRRDAARAPRHARPAHLRRLRRARARRSARSLDREARRAVDGGHLSLSRPRRPPSMASAGRSPRRAGRRACPDCRPSTARWRSASRRSSPRASRSDR